MKVQAVKEQDIIRPDWPAPPNIGALSTTRDGGVSRGAWASLNLGEHCGDDKSCVRENRDRLQSLLPSEPVWLRQVHGSTVLNADEEFEPMPVADAAVTRKPGQVLAVMTADCLPVLICDEKGEQVGVVHAGWRGLCDGVIEATVKAMQTDPGRLIAWLGPAIGKDAYEVGEDVLESYARRSGSNLVAAFTSAGNKWKLDLAGAARTILYELGVNRILGGSYCTFREQSRFFSYRRDGVTGRMASLLWIENI